MKNVVLKYGLFAFLTASALFLIALYFGQGMSFKTQELVGYATMIISLTFVYFGIKQYRDYEKNGSISFKTAFVVGILISAFAAIGFGIIDVIYVTKINPDFAEQYMAYELQNIETSGMTLEKMNEAKLSLKKQMEAFNSPAIVGFIMFMMVLVIGVIISLLSALVLHSKDNS